MVPVTKRGPVLHEAAPLIVRLAWLLAIGLTLLVFGISLLARYSELLTPCLGPSCTTAQPSPSEVLVLQQRGIALESYARFFVALEALFALAFTAVALVIASRKSDRFGLFVSLALVTFGVMLPSSLRSLYDAGFPLSFLVHLIEVLGWGSFFTFFYLFPDGRFVPDRTRSRPLILALWGVAWILTSRANLFTWPLPLALLVFLAWFGSGMTAQLYRYFRVSGPVERQQTKWVVFGFGAATAGILLYLLPLLLVPTLREPGPSRVLFYLIGTPVFAAALFTIPATIAISMLKYRLWEIDVLINRTLVYGLLSGTLALVYASFVVLLQYLFHLLTGQGDNLAITVSTLATAVLFNPLRNRTQAFIDRRFYRRKYDAEQVLAAFGTMLRREVDLDRLVAALIAVVEETVQPAHVSLWLRLPASRRPAPRPDSAPDGPAPESIT